MQIVSQVSLGRQTKARGRKTWGLRRFRGQREDPRRLAAQLDLEGVVFRDETVDRAPGARLMMGERAMMQEALLDSARHRAPDRSSAR